MPKELKSSEDQTLFDWTANEASSTDAEEDYELWAMAGISVDSIKDLQAKAAYARYLETYTED
jgi:hypothetical protein